MHGFEPRSAAHQQHLAIVARDCRLVTAKCCEGFLLLPDYDLYSACRLLEGSNA